MITQEELTTKVAQAFIACDIDAVLGCSHRKSCGPMAWKAAMSMEMLECEAILSHLLYPSILHPLTLPVQNQRPR